MVNLGLTLPLRRGPSGYFETTQDLQVQLRTNLTNLLLTRKGERPFQPEFGSTLEAVVFEQLTDDGVSNIEGAIQSAVSQWMPFINIDDIDIQRNDAENRVSIRVTFSLASDDSILDSITLVF